MSDLWTGLLIGFLFSVIAGLITSVVALVYAPSIQRVIGYRASIINSRKRDRAKKDYILFKALHTQKEDKYLYLQGLLFKALSYFAFSINFGLMTVAVMVLSTGLSSEIEEASVWYRYTTYALAIVCVAGCSFALFMATQTVAAAYKTIRVLANFRLYDAQFHNKWPYIGSE